MEFSIHIKYANLFSFFGSLDDSLPFNSNIRFCKPRLILGLLDSPVSNIKTLDVYGCIKLGL